ncbi:MAG: hypothetical protein JKX81_11950 [Arenicella sp.]|nr:hypothetical protein [Arenicella sp.]
MLNTDNPVLGFFAWWKQGLLSPLPKAEAIRVVLTVVDNVVCDSDGQALSQADIDQLGKDADLYLLAAPEKVMSKRIADAQKGLPLSDIVEEVLPFDASELIVALVVAQGDEQDQLHCLVRSELVDPLSTCKAIGLVCSGVAFDVSEQRLFARLDDQLLVSEPKMPKYWLLALLLLIIALLSSSVYLSHSESQKNKALAGQLNQLREPVSGVQVNEAAAKSIKPLIRAREAEQIIAVLTSITESLPEAAIIDQLILSGNELVIDASAVSATQVQANLDSSGAFEATEFITTISRSANDDRERFRLKARISEGR